MRYFLLVLMLALLSCSISEPQDLGEIVDFTIHMGSWLSADRSVVVLKDGRKIAVSTTRISTGMHLYSRIRRRGEVEDILYNVPWPDSVE